MTILETVIAATLISVAIVATLKLSTNTQKETSYSRDVSLATKYNYQAVDWLKNIKSELGWASFINEIDIDGGSPLYCLNNLPDLTSAFASLSPTSKETCSLTFIDAGTFYRVAQLTLDPSGNSVEITVTTYWQGNIEHSVSAETSITNY